MGWWSRVAVAGGQRRYSRDQLEQLMFVAHEVSEGLSPGDAHRLLADRGSAAPRNLDAAASGVLILLAERDPYAASYLDYFLRTEGYRVELAQDAEEAERRFASLSPQLVIVELLLSGGARRRADRTAQTFRCAGHRDLAAGSRGRLLGAGRRCVPSEAD